MTVTQRGTTWFVDVCLGGKRKQARRKSEIDAKRQEIKFIEEMNAEATNTKALEGSWSVGKALDRTWEQVWQGSKSARMYEVNIKAVKDYFGADKSLALIDTNAIDAWVTHLKSQKGNCGGTVNRKLATLSKAMTVARDRGGLAAKPAIPRQKEAKGRVRWLSAEEEAEAFTYLKEWGKHDHIDMLTVLLDTGLRLGELFPVTPKDISLDTRMIGNWVTKSGEARSIPMTGRVYEIIKRRMKTHPNRLFPYNHKWVYRVWKKLRKPGFMNLAGDKQFTPHCLRHSCATRLVTRGYSMAKLQRWLGHETPAMTNRYAHLAPADLVDGIKLLEDSSETVTSE